MKATGIVRRIDDLGRVVIPKEIRRTMRIKEGDPLEIFTDREGEVIFKKYSPIGELSAFAAQYAETLHKICDLSVVVCDRDAVIACAGAPRRELMDKGISSGLEQVIEKRSFYQYKQGGDTVSVTEEGNHTVSCAMPIISQGDLIGCVCSVISGQAADVQPGETEVKLIQTAANFLARQLES